jgi:hypothetical protein
LAVSTSTPNISIAPRNHRHLFPPVTAIRHILNALTFQKIFWSISRLSSPILLLVFSALAATTDPSAIRTAAGEVTTNLQVQTRLPNDSGTADSTLDRTTRKGWNFGGDGIYIPGGEAIFGLIQWALITAAIIAILAVIAILVREPLQSRFHPVVSPPIPLSPDAAPPADPRDLLARADRLAAVGQFAEAMHCILLAAMLLLGGPSPDKSAVSRTSWELLRSAPLAPPQHHALRDLVIRVERAWFGQRPAGPDDYRHVRGIFDAFQSPPAGPA